MEHQRRAVARPLILLGGLLLILAGIGAFALWSAQEAADRRWNAVVEALCEIEGASVAWPVADEVKSEKRLFGLTARREVELDLGRRGEELGGGAYVHVTDTVLHLVQERRLLTTTTWARISHADPATPTVLTRVMSALSDQGVPLGD